MQQHTLRETRLHVRGSMSPSLRRYLLPSIVPADTVSPPAGRGSCFSLIHQGAKINNHIPYPPWLQKVTPHLEKFLLDLITNLILKLTHTQTIVFMDWSIIIKYKRT